MCWPFYNYIQSDFFTDFPLTHSVAKELEAMAEPHPNVLNFASTILPFSSTLIWKIDKFIITNKTLLFNTNQQQQTLFKGYIKKPGDMLR